MNSGDWDKLMDLSLYGSPVLREAIRRNFVTFPGQMMSSSGRTQSNVRERIVQLYFVRGWSVRSLCERYGLHPARIRGLLDEWRLWAIRSGYIQAIDEGYLDELTPEPNFGKPRLRQQLQRKVFAAPVADLAESMPGAPLFEPTSVANILSEVRGRW